MFLQKQNQHEIPITPTAISARVPIQIDLRLQPGDPLNRSVYFVLRFPLTQEIMNTIKSLAVTEHISIEDAFVTYLKQVIPRQKKMQNIISQLHQEVTLDVQLKGKIIWEVAEEQLFFNS